MNYHSIGFFAVFLPAVIVLYQLCRQQYRWLLLLAADLIFFTLWCGPGVLFFLASAAITWVFGEKLRKMEKVPPGTDKNAFKKKKKHILAAGILCVLSLLAVLKYTNFIGRTFMGSDWVTVKLIVPIGISYYTLQAVSYLCDVASGKGRAAPSFCRLALYMSFFPTIAEGPIARYDEIGGQLEKGEPVSYVNLTQGYQRILWGLFKKIVIADHIGPAMESLYASYRSFGSMSLFAIVLCTIQIYTDFSGTIDIAIGTGRFFGIELPENFRQPFFAKNAGEFWRRWHITLGAFLRTYVFYPVSLSKPVSKLTKLIRKHSKKAARYVAPMISLFCVWMCSGIWHGPSWTYVGYGMYYFVLIFAEVLLEPFVRKHINENRLWFRIFRFIKLCIIVGIGELFFMAPNVGVAMEMFTSIFTNFSAATFLNEWTALGPGLSDYLITFGSFSVVVVISILKEKNISIRAGIESLPVPVRWAFWYAAILIVIFFGAYGPGFTALDMMYAGF